MQNLYIGKVAKYEKFTKYGFCAAREKPEGGLQTPPPGHIGLMLFQIFLAYIATKIKRKAYALVRAIWSMEES